MKCWCNIMYIMFGSVFLEGTGKDCTHEFLVGDLNRPTHLSVFLTKDIGQTLEQNTRLDECVEREALFPLRVVAIQQALYEVRRQTIAHLRQHCNTKQTPRFTHLSSDSHMNLASSQWVSHMRVLPVGKARLKTWGALLPFLFLLPSLPLFLSFSLPSQIFITISYLSPCTKCFKTLNATCFLCNYSTLWCRQRTW